MGISSAISDANGKQTQYAYEVGNQLTQITDPAGGSTRFSYESAECSSCGVTANLAALIDAKNAIWSYEYDSRSLGTQTRDPLGNTEQFAYDARENLLAKTDSNGATVRFEYDGNNRLVRKAYPDGSETRFGYDVNGNLVSASNQHVTYTFSYDALNRLTSVQDSRYSQPTQYSYDRAGRRKSDDGTGWRDTSYTYTLHGLVESITGPGGQSIQFEYDPLGRRSRTRRSNGTQTTYTYDAAGFVNTIQHLGPDGGVLEQFAYTYDKAGNRTSMTDSSGAHTYGYDDRYQLRGSGSS